MINQKSRLAVPLRFCNLAKLNIDPEQKIFDHKCQRSRLQSMAYQRVTSHGNYCGNFLLFRFLSEIFSFGAVNPIIGTSFPYNSAKPPNWLPKTPFMPNMAKIISEIDFIT